MIVEMILMEPSRDEVIRKIIPRSQKVWPFGWCAMSLTVARGEYDVHPDLAAPPGTKKLANMITPPMK